MTVSKMISRIRKGWSTYLWHRPQLSRSLFQPLHVLTEQRYLRRVLRHFDVDCVFDVGANQGQYAQLLRKGAKYKGLIVSFEPHPEVFTQLERRAGRDRNWTVENKALSAKTGEQNFNLMAAHQFSSLSNPSGEGTRRLDHLNKVVKQVSVKTETLRDAFLRLRAEHGFKRPFLKMDTQGYDLTVVESGKEIIAEFIGLQSELAIKVLYEDSLDFRETLRRYESVGFTLSQFIPNNHGHFPEFIELDCVMLRSDLLGV